MRGRDAWCRNMEVMKSAFPDVTAHIEDIFSSEDRVAVRLTMRGTHTGEFLGISPSGRPVEYTSIELYRITDGLIAEEWICSDMATLMRQIGSSQAA
ncbi:MAG: ester cyclase [Hyphomicrobiales bacterium]|nr:ester cyclase [Hyphomicrobiales bacterium]